MRCTCQNCGTYMVQDEKGTFSRCICPDCFTTCNACMGTSQQPLTRDGLQNLALQREQYDSERESTDDLL
ncbi:MAG: hypothetical protein RRZ24_09400 [Clostridia bacterium]